MYDQNYYLMFIYFLFPQIHADFYVFTRYADLRGEFYLRNLRNIRDYLREQYPGDNFGFHVP
jgi:hypothetical protein